MLKMDEFLFSDYLRNSRSEPEPTSYLELLNYSPYVGPFILITLILDNLQNGVENTR